MSIYRNFLRVPIRKKRLRFLYILLITFILHKFLMHAQLKFDCGNFSLVFSYSTNFSYKVPTCFLSTTFIYNVLSTQSKDSKRGNTNAQTMNIIMMFKSKHFSNCIIGFEIVFEKTLEEAQFVFNFETKISF